MPRYINVEDALQAHPEFLNEQIDDHDKAIYAKGWNACNSAYHDAIKEIDSVSPDEVRGVGTWLRKEKVRHNLDGDGDYRYECSACGHSDEHNENVHVPFCWYCGAKMEVEGDA